MIQANELRIGNCVEANSPMMIVKEITEHTVGLYMPGSEADPFLFDIDEITPIPLTPEILEKCGFRKYKDDNAGKIFKSFRYNKICIQYRTKESRGLIVWYDSNDDYGITLPSINITFLHQLQNLYYALTGEELIYTP